jgi:hypothetical protein
MHIGKLDERAQKPALALTKKSCALFFKNIDARDRFKTFEKKSGAWHCVLIFKNKTNLQYFNLREYILHNFKKIETQKGHTLLENALHVSSNSAKNSACQACMQEIISHVFSL